MYWDFGFFCLFFLMRNLLQESRNLWMLHCWNHVSCYRWSPSCSVSVSSVSVTWYEGDGRGENPPLPKHQHPCCTESHLYTSSRDHGQLMCHRYPPWWRSETSRDPLVISETTSGSERKITVATHIEQCTTAAHSLQHQIEHLVRPVSPSVVISIVVSWMTSAFFTSSVVDGLMP